MSSATAITILVILALAFDFLNGFHDSANVVATMISSRAMSPRAALAFASSANFLGPFLFGVAVAKTVGNEIVSPNSITIQMVLAALISASLWNLLTWFFGIPSSSSHALIGGIIGAVAIGSSLSEIRLDGLTKVAVALFLSPIIGFVIGLFIMRLTVLLFRDASPKANILFKLAQVPTALALSLSHGTNDAQKTMGVITLGLVILGFQQDFEIPTWVILASASAIGIGTAVGGWRLIHTLGAKFYRVRPIHSFTSQLTSTIVILGASLLGGPVSTTQVVSSSIIGVGAAQRKSQVRWGVTTEIIMAWFLTVPASACVAGLTYFPLNYFLP